MSNELVVGADACPAGWFVTVIEQETVSTAAYERFEEIRETHAGADRILVDIPIGLPTDVRRRCDTKASDLLGCRGNSVFYPPSESAIECDDYDEANARQQASTGNGLSQQAFNIGQRIREVNSVVGSRYDGLVRESHPELCFAALNGQPIAYSKSSKVGQALRLELLSQELKIAEAVYQEVREDQPLTDVRRDDILDSMVLAVAARAGDLTTVPADPGRNEPRIYYLSFERPAFSLS